MSDSMSMSNNKGYITLIIGPMFSGKTTELIRLIKRATIAGKKCVVVKYDKDIRYGDELHTHDLVEYIASYKCNDLNQLQEIYKEYDVIAIDEGSFIKNINMVDEWANNGKIIYISALDADFNRNPFANITNLIAKTEVIIKLSAICKCGENASFTYRKNDNVNLEVIGGSEIYNALCRTCYNKLL